MTRLRDCKSVDVVLRRIGRCSILLRVARGAWYYPSAEQAFFSARYVQTGASNLFKAAHPPTIPTIPAIHLPITVCTSESGVICISRNAGKGRQHALARSRTCERTGAHTLLVVASRKKIAAISGLLCCCSTGTMASRWRIFVEITVESTRLCEKCRSSPYYQSSSSLSHRSSALLAPLQSK